MPKIVFIFYSYFGGFAGANIYLFEFLKRIQNINYFKNVVVMSNQVGKNIIEREGIKNVKFIILNTSLHPINYFFELFKRAIKTPIIHLDEGDIIFSSSDRISDVLSALRIKKANKGSKWIASFYHIVPPPLKYFKTPLRLVINDIIRWIENRIVLYLIRKNADAVFTESSFIVRYFPNIKKIIIFKGGIDQSIIDSTKNIKKIYDACFVGRLFEYKGVYDLIKAWKIVSKVRKGAKLFIIGGGKDFIKVKKFIVNENLVSNIIILNNITDEIKNKIMSLCKIFVLPSYAEGIPIVFFEAMACGLPIVTYFLPTYIDIISFIKIVNIGDYNALAYKILELLLNQKKLYLESKKVQKFASNYIWDEIIIKAINEIVVWE